MGDKMQLPYFICEILVMVFNREPWSGMTHGTVDGDDTWHDWWG
jgi:hypothetical protein